MTTTHTFNVHFWLKKSSIRKDGTIPIYARIWIDSIPVDFSTKEAISEEQWSTKAGRARTRTKNAKHINEILDDVRFRIKKAYKQLKAEGRSITAQAIKLRYLGKAKAVLSCKDLIRHHSENEFEKLAEGTVKNYSATEKYVYHFIKKQFKSDVVY
ncbi:MAG: Arm DNA-binding domain-containing protein [Pricia sp.]